MVLFAAGAQPSRWACVQPRPRCATTARKAKKKTKHTNKKKPNPKKGVIVLRICVILAENPKSSGFVLPGG